jgi:serine/threonine protein kinase
MGSFGEVWVGQNRLFPEQRAFKFFTQEGARDWLEQEANALSQIKSRLGNCPNAIRYEDIAIDAEPYPFLVLEFVGGGSLEEWILSPPADRRPLDVHELMTGIARGLAEAHNHRIFHRDLKPANVLLSDEPDPVPKIADFGLSRVETDAPAGSSLASQPVLVGTGMYLPPESADPYTQRKPAQDDVFAFGVVWYQILVGRIERPPYDFVDRLHNQGVDSRTIRLLSRCLAHPSRRYPDGGTLLADLEVETGPEVWNVPDGCFDVGPLAREYIDSQLR